MTGTPAATPPLADPLAEPGPPRPASFADALRSEWTKLRSLRSSFFTIAATVVLVVGLGALIANVAARNTTHNDPTWDPTMVSLAGFGIGQLSMAVLGVLTVTGEYSSGMIRTTLTAVPRRLRLLAAKSVVYTAVTTVTAEVVAFSAFFLGQAVIRGHQPTAHLSQPGVARAVVGAGLYVAVIGLMAVALGTLLRHTAGAIVTVVAILFVLPGVLQALPPSWRNPVEEYWPTQAGAQVFNLRPGLHTLSPWWGFADLLIFVAVLMALAAVRLRRSDA